MSQVGGTRCRCSNVGPGESEVVAALGRAPEQRGQRWPTAESPSLVLVINDTKLLMPYVKWFELGISNTCDEGACGME
jgi:hypothetical protein